MKVKITDFDIKISAENAASFLDADKTGDLYDEIMDELCEMIPRAYEMITPVALLEFGSLDGYSVKADGQDIREALFGVCSIGRGMERWSTSLFSQGDYLGGMLADAIADDYLFQMDAAVQKRVIEMCRERGKGIAARAEAPQDLPMSVQKRAWDVTRAAEEGIGIKESFMYDPVKSICQVYLLDENTKRYHAEHDCSRCGSLTCKRRKLPLVPICVHTKSGETEIKGRKADSLLKTLREHDFFISAVCGGRGTCGKCAVRFLRGVPDPSDEDRRFFTEEELERGLRLACRAYPSGPCEVFLDEEEREFSVLAKRTGEKEGSISKLSDSSETVYAAAADIGTTTIAIRLMKMPEGTPAGVYTDMNRQRVYGADVISRIEASNAGKKDALQKCILNQIEKGLASLMKGRKGTVRSMVIGGNSTMIHLMMGYSCEGLGVYPFTPVNISAICLKGRELFPGWKEDLDITVCPGISAFVGGDITAGLYALDFDRKEKPCVLIDLGTNGEMAIGCGERILVTSTAAGPAFEGGNIVCGTGSIPGAVCSVEILDGRTIVETIGGKAARGICGTGVIDTVYELKKEGVIDETGLMEAPWFDAGFLLSDENGRISFFQKDVRELQLAKSAVRAGLETLITRYGISYDEIGNIYIAGGFGHQMNVRKAAGIGLLPRECLEKISAEGNTCLRGLEKALTDEEGRERMRRLAETAEEVQLSNDSKFQEFYMEYMCFE